MKKNRKEYKDGSCFKTWNKFKKAKYQIKFELINKYSLKKFPSIKEYNKFLDEETEKIYSLQG